MQHIGGLGSDVLFKLKF